MKLSIPLLASALLISASCGKEDKDGSDNTAPKVRSKESPTVAKKASGLDGLFTGTSVALPSEIAKLVFGKSESENQRLLGQDSNLQFSEKFENVNYQLRNSNDKTKSVDVQARVDLEPLVTKKWGTPTKNKDGIAYWFNPETKLRAHISEYGKGKTLVIDPYQPLDELLGDSGFTFRFAKDKALLGATIEELHEAWGERLCRYEEQGPKLIKSFNASVEDSLNSFPPTYGSQIDLCWNTPRAMGTGVGNDKLSVGANGRISDFRMTIPADGSSEIVASSIAFLDKKLGAAQVVTTDNGQEHHYFSSEEKLKVKATITKDKRSIHVVYSQHLPLEELLGGEGPGLSIEPEGIFGTYEEIQKASPDSFQPSGVLATLVYPGTEYSSGLTEIRLTKMARAKKVSEYKLVLHYKNYPELEARILKLLEAKFGPALESKRKASKGKFIDFKAKGKRKLEVWQVSDQFQITFTQ